MCKINLLDKISFILVMLGAIAWGFIGILNINILSILVGESEILSRIIYILVFLSATNLLYVFLKCKNLLNYK